MTDNTHPVIIQGGMGAAVSSWTLARAVSKAGQLGVVSGTALDVILARRLQMGDPGGDLRAAMAEFPFPEMSQRILDRYFVEGGKAAGDRFVSKPMPSLNPSQTQLELLVVSNFVEVHLAKKGHDGLVGVNYLEKIQLPNLPSMFGAMLAGVDYVLMGAGIPRTIPGILDQLARGEEVELSVHVEGAEPGEEHCTKFDPMKFCNQDLPWLKRPNFLAIVSSQTLATMLSRKSTGRVDGFVIEGPTAGGHNAPPRGAMQMNDRGEPIYGDRDVPNLAVFRKLGVPFWLAGSHGTPEALAQAVASGAAGIQVGTAFAFCDESGMDAEIRQDALDRVRTGTADVYTDPLASPTGFPFKVLQEEESLSNQSVYEARKRVCDLGYLRHAYKKEDGTVGWRCPSEPVEDFLRKGGCESETVGRKCVCNGLMANVSLGQIQKSGTAEKPLITCGDDVVKTLNFLPSESAKSYSALDVINRLLSRVPSPKGVLRTSDTRQKLPVT